MIAALLWFLLALLFLVHLGGVAGWLRAPRVLPVLRAPKTGDTQASEKPRHPDPAPLLSIIIPARNEEEVVEGCVGSYLRQDYPSIEVIVVDDRSTDGTTAILARLEKEHAALKIINGRPHPEGWTGKNFAAFQGYEASTGEYLLFVDADTVAGAPLISRAFNMLESEGIDLLTAGTRPIFQSFWDRLIIPMIGHFFFLLIRQANNPDSKAAGANGPFLLFRRSVYEAVGGHEGLKGEMLEDQVFGEKVKGSGYRVKLVLAHELLSQHFYKSFGELREGWVKILYYNISRDKKILRNVLTPVNILLIFFVPWMLFAAGAFSIAFGVDGAWAARFLFAGGATCLLSSLAQALMQRFIGVRGPIYPFLQPMAAVLLALIWADAAYRFFSGGAATWKGRAFTRTGPEAGQTPRF